MKFWNKKILADYRDHMGWVPLDDEIAEQVLTALNNIHAGIDGIEGISWIEPDLRFRAADANSVRGCVK
ncbi:MAG: hypothetical protein ABW168_25845 [Sedimenticola sp.]